MNGLGWRLRKQLPGFIRRPLKWARVLVTPTREVPRVPPELWAECRVAPSRSDLIGQLPKGGRVAEIGTHTGRFARHILAAANPSELHVIDLDLSRFDRNLAADPRVRVHQGDSATTIGGFPDGWFDWIYVDGDHRAAAVTRDAEAAAPKLRAGGYLVFNDFAHIDPSLGVYGVHSAVMGFAAKHRWPIAWLAYQRAGLYDIALRRPAGKPGT